MLSLAYGLTCYPSEPCGSNASFVDPAKTLRVATALLQYAPLTSGDDSEAKLALQVRKSGCVMTMRKHCGVLIRSP